MRGVGWITGCALALLTAGPWASRPAQADAIVVTRAMQASTIAEIFVEPAQVRVALEIGPGDLRAFALILPDDSYQRLGHAPRPVAERHAEFLREGFLVHADGVPLAGTLTLDVGRRVPRDEITGEPLPVATDGGEPVLRLELRYALATRPRTLTFQQPRRDGQPAASIGFVAYHRGLAVNDPRYFLAKVTLDLDWKDPWYSRFRHRNLARKFAAPLSVYLYVEPFEVRQEVVLRPRDLQHWTDLGLEGRDALPAGAQAEVIRKVVAFLQTRNPLTIDGQVVERRLDRAHFIRRTLRTTGIIDPPEDLDLASATLGVIFYVPREARPERVATRWELWNPQIQVVPAAASDEAGALPTRLTPEAPELVWQNFLRGPSRYALTAVPTPPGSRSWPLPLASLLVLAVGLWLARRARATSRARVLVTLVVTCLVAALLWAVLPLPMSLPGTPGAQVTDAESSAVLAGLLHNTYRSFDRREDELVYDRLARSVSGALLQQAFLEIRRRMELENQGGARVKVRGVRLLSSETKPLEAMQGFAGTCTWDVVGSVGHWGHVHQRANRYTADVRVQAVDGVWKLTRLDVTDEQRMGPGAR